MNGERCSVRSAALILGVFTIVSTRPLPCFGQDLFFGSPQELASKIKQGSHEEQAKLARLLQLTSFKPEDGFADCEVKVREAKLEREHETSLVQIGCSYDLDLVVLEEVGGRWRWLDSFPVNNAYNFANVEFASLIEPPLQEVIIHKDCTARGTGLYWGNFLVLKILDGHFRIVFDALEEGNETPFSEPSRTIKSTFALSPASGNNPAEIEETSTIQIGNASYQIKREFEWDSMWRKFASAGIDTVIRTGK